MDEDQLIREDMLYGRFQGAELMINYIVADSDFGTQVFMFSTVERDHLQNVRAS